MRVKVWRMEALGVEEGVQWMGLSTRDGESAVELWRLVCGVWGVACGWGRRGWAGRGACGWCCGMGAAREWVRSRRRT